MIFNYSHLLLRQGRRARDQVCTCRDSIARYQGSVATFSAYSAQPRRLPTEGINNSGHYGEEGSAPQLPGNSEQSQSGKTLLKTPGVSASFLTLLKSGSSRTGHFTADTSQDRRTSPQTLMDVQRPLWRVTSNLYTHLLALTGLCK